MAEKNQGKGNNLKGGNLGGETSKRNLASMDPEKQREIASEGGKASHGGGRNGGSGNNRGGNNRNK